MEQEIHNLLVELFKRYTNKRAFFIKKYFAGNEYTYSDIEQDFYLKLFKEIVKDQDKLDIIQNESYFNRSLQNFIIDYFRKNKSQAKIFTFQEDELFDHVITKHVHSEMELSSEIVTINLSYLIETCQFNEIEIELIKQHYFYNVKYVKLNQVYNHSNTQQKIGKLIIRLNNEFLKIQNQNKDFTVILINDIT